MEDYRSREWLAVLGVVEELLDKLQWMAESGNQIIRPRIEAILQGEARSQLLITLRQRHDTLDFDEELRLVVHEEMQKLQMNKPELFGIYRQLNNVSAAVRPVTSIVLFSIGFGPAGEIVAPFLGHAAASAAVHVFADVAGGATAAIAGEAAVSSAASSGTGILQAWFHRLHAAFTARRAGWLTQLIHAELLGQLPEELNAAAELSASEAYLEVQKSVIKLEALL